ncbi:PglD-related sugar-binding protein [Ancylobacter mangrovi]|uniref:PglD-related sugar-binding protein n=1 Tax=Ancylobacter mangrovi TaxID=2972472 RepID=UPI0028680DB8|nr:hypothetical protein [Ancylobacter mangrovi]
MSVPNIVIYGASGQGWALETMLQDVYKVARIIAYIDDIDGDKGLEMAGKPLITRDSWLKIDPLPDVFISVGNAAHRRMMADKIAAAGGRLLDIRHIYPSLFPHIEVGVGTIVASPCYVGPGTIIGNNIQLMPMCSIGHDVTIHDHCNICPSATISGYVVIEEEVYVGGGATITNGRRGRPLVIGKGATIAVGAVVTKSVAPGATVMGNPAVSPRELARSRRR